jgi:hypothetical protein
VSENTLWSGTLSHALLHGLVKTPKILPPSGYRFLELIQATTSAESALANPVFADTEWHGHGFAHGRT